MSDHQSVAPIGPSLGPRVRPSHLGRRDPFVILLIAPALSTPSPANAGVVAPPVSTAPFILEGTTLNAPPVPEPGRLVVTSSPPGSWRPFDPNSVTFSPDGKSLAAGSGANTVTIWDARTGREVLTLKGHTAAVNSVTFSPDGKRLASGGEDHTIKIWDAQTGRDLLTIQGHTGPFESVAFSPDGKRLVSGSYDETINMWDAQTGQDLLTLKGNTGVVNSTAIPPER